MLVGGEQGEAMRVLVIEDDPEFLSFLRVYIDGLEAVDEVTYASCGTDGMRAALTEPFDVVVIDFHLQDMDGEEVARAIRGRDGTPRIIGFSGSTEGVGWADTCITKGGKESLDLLKDALTGSDT